MMSHDDMMNNGSYRNGYRGLHYFGSGIFRNAAADAARAVFEACDGKASGWKSWVHPSGKMLKMAFGLMAKFLDDHPDATAEAIYIHVSRFPCGGPKNIPISNGTMWGGALIPWKDAPLAVHGAYEAFRSTYLHLWLLARTHDARMAKARPPREKPRLVNSDMMETMGADNAGGMGSRERLRRNVVPLGRAENPRSEPPGAHGAMLADRDQASVAEVGQEPDGCPATDPDESPDGAA